MSFYTGEKQKFYNSIGGIMTIISLIISLVVFITITLEDFKRINPQISTSEILSTGYKKIKFGKEKIWIPWRVATYEEKLVDHKGILYPIIYYYSGKWADNNGMNLSNKKLNYKLCSETSMINHKDDFQIDVPLNELFCIEMDDLEIGGSWISDSINYLQFDLYLCKNGEEFDINNPNCTSFDSIMKKSEGTSWLFEFFYPVIQFEFSDLKNPVRIKYRSRFYNLSKYTSKIERIYLKENIICDDDNLLVTELHNSSYWSLGYLDGDSYYYNGIDLIKEGSSSRIYSFKIYLDLGFYLYKRSYKKLIDIVSKAYPIIYFIMFIIRGITKIFKTATLNRRLAELIFSDIKQKQKVEQIKSETVYFNRNNIPQSKKFSGIISYTKNKDKKKLIELNESKNCLADKMKTYEHKLIFSHKNLTPNIIIYDSQKLKNNNNESDIKIEKKLDNNQNQILINNKDIDENNKYILNKNLSNEKNKSPSLIRSNIIGKASESRYLSKKLNGIFTMENFEILKDRVNTKVSEEKVKEKHLFNYKYYVCGFLLRNFYVSKENYFLPETYMITYNFMCHICDISSYIILFKQFYILINSCIDENFRTIINSDQTININNRDSMKEISNKFSKAHEIFSKAIENE